MIEEVVSVDLAVHERLTVRKNRLAPKQLTGNEANFHCDGYAWR